MLPNRCHQPNLCWKQIVNMYIQELASQSVNEVKHKVAEIFLYLAIVPLEFMFATYHHLCTSKILIMCKFQTGRACRLSFQPMPYEFQPWWVQIPLHLGPIKALGNRKFRHTIITISGPTTSTPSLSCCIPEFSFHIGVIVCRWC